MGSRRPVMFIRIAQCRVTLRCLEFKPSFLSPGKIPAVKVNIVP